MKCEICRFICKSGRGLSYHLRYTHNMLTKEYYDTYIKTENEGLCKVCGKQTGFRGFSGYHIYCSKKCASNDIDIINKSKKTCIERYGVSTGFNTKESHIKAKQTCIQKYGTYSPLGSDEIRDKIKSTNLKRYGCDNGGASKQAQDKIKKTLLKRYGVDNAIHIPGNMDKLNSPEAKKKGNETRRKNNTFNSSKPEDNLYQELISIFGINDVFRHYKSILYPFSCDFYIKPLDMYIELNLHWTHSNHFFNENNENDLTILNKWIEKSKTSKFYKNAIITWTKRDVLKRDTAVKNKLNYVVLWNADDVNNFIERYRNEVRD